MRPVWCQAAEMYYALCDVSQELSYDSITQYEAELLESHKKLIFYAVLSNFWIKNGSQ
jgi:hypothetical protein